MRLLLLLTALEVLACLVLSRVGAWGLRRGTTETQGRR